MKKNVLICSFCLVIIYFISSIFFQTQLCSSETSVQDAEILDTWQGDYPVSGLALLPENQRETAAGFIDNTSNFINIWELFKPDIAVPTVDFVHNMILFARNTQFYNRISIGRVVLKDGIAEIVAMETMSAMPIEDKVGMSLAIVPRTGIKGIKAGDNIIGLSNN